MLLLVPRATYRAKSSCALGTSALLGGTRGSGERRGASVSEQAARAISAAARESDRIMIRLHTECPIVAPRSRRQHRDGLAVGDRRGKSWIAAQARARGCCQGEGETSIVQCASHPTFARRERSP